MKIRGLDTFLMTLVDSKLIEYAKKIEFSPERIFCLNMLGQLDSLKKIFPYSQVNQLEISDLGVNNFCQVSGADLILVNFALKMSYDFEHVLQNINNLMKKSDMLIFASLDHSTKKYLSHDEIVDELQIMESLQAFDDIFVMSFRERLLNDHPSSGNCDAHILLISQKKFPTFELVKEEFEMEILSERDHLSTYQEVKDDYDRETDEFELESKNEINEINIEMTEKTEEPEKNLEQEDTSEMIFTDANSEALAVSEIEDESYDIGCESLGEKDENQEEKVASQEVAQSEAATENEINSEDARGIDDEEKSEDEIVNEDPQDNDDEEEREDDAESEAADENEDDSELEEDGSEDENEVEEESENEESSETELESENEQINEIESEGENENDDDEEDDNEGENDSEDQDHNDLDEDDDFETETNTVVEGETKNVSTFINEDRFRAQSSTSSPFSFLRDQKKLEIESKKVFENNKNVIKEKSLKK